MSVTIRFCGAARTVTGSCYLLRDPIRALPGRLRPVSGTEDPEGAELRRVSFSPRRYRCGPADPCPYRPQRPAAQAGAQRLSRPHPCDARHHRSLLLHAAGCRQHPGSPRSPPSTGATRRAGAPRSARSIRRPMRSPRCSRSRRSTTKNGSTLFRAFARATGTPGICSAPPRSRSNSPMTTHPRNRCVCSRPATSAPTPNCCSPIPRRRQALTTSSRNRPMATGSVRQSRLMHAARVSPRRSATRPPARARC